MKSIEKIKRANLFLDVASKINNFQEQSMKSTLKGESHFFDEVVKERQVLKNVDVEDVVINLITRAIKLSAEAEDQMYEQDVARESGLRVSEDFINV